ncbi:MAG TPA: hypothetical protein VFW17_20595 [Ktedonobacterales bacterium]|nr:hypothetical protein [Ktedonobacterales bacterium]
MPTSQVDLTSVSLRSELVLRGGNLTDARAQESARAQYLLSNNHYHDVHVGLSCLFRPGASFDDLAQEGAYRNATLSVTVVQHLMDELAVIGCAPVLYVTPTLQYPDHHTLVFLRAGVLEVALAQDVVEALARAMMVVKNPHQRKQ